jgi:mono/diheme cytochrome c family protein
VRGGALRYAGMAGFADTLSKRDAAAIKAYIVDDEIARRTHQRVRAVARTRYH